MAPNNQDFDSDIPVLEDLVMVEPPERDWMASDVAFSDDELAQDTTDATPLETAPATTPETNIPAAEAPAQEAAPETPIVADNEVAQSAADSYEPGRAKPLPRDNPFLPYEHLEQLARERVEFQKQFAQFAIAQQSFRPQWSNFSSPGGQAASGNHAAPGGYTSAPGSYTARNSYTPSASTPRPTSSQTGASSNLLLDNLTRQLTQEVIQDLRPEIEQRVRRLLEQRFAEWSDKS